MFEDIDDKKPQAADEMAAAAKLVVTRDANDRALLYAVWTRNAGGSMPVHEAWALLHDRYPDDARFVLLAAYEELIYFPRAGVAWTPSTFLAKVRSILDSSGGRLNPEVRDLLAVAEDDLHPLSEEDSARLDRIRARVSSRTAGDPAASRKRLTRLAADVVRELHDRTIGGKPIGRTSGPLPAAASSEWKSQLAAATGAKTTYSATAKVAAGDVVEHPKFGAGVVLGVEPGRANILFESGARKLVAG
jgi:hypothetical protein